MVLVIIGIALAQYPPWVMPRVTRGLPMEGTPNPWAFIKRNRLRYRSPDVFADFAGMRPPTSPRLYQRSFPTFQARTFGSDDDFFYPSEAFVMKRFARSGYHY